MKIAFVWDFEKEGGLQYWLDKDDSFQYTIKKLAYDRDPKTKGVNECTIFAKSKQSIDGASKDGSVKCSLRPTWQKLMIALGMFKPDIIFAQGFGTTLSNALPDFFKNTKKILTYVGGPLEGRLIPYDVISVSREYQKEYLMRKGKEAQAETGKKYNLNVVVIPYGVDIKRFKMQNVKRLIDVVVVADNLPVKRLHLLKEAQKKLKDLRFSFVGYEVRIPYGYIPNIFSAAKISAIVSTREDGGPRVVPESLACGAPVLTCWDSEGVWSATKKFTDVGDVVSPDVDSIVFGIKDLIARVSDKEEMRKQCREIAVKELSYEQMYKKYKVIVYELFKEIKRL